MRVGAATHCFNVVLVEHVLNKGPSLSPQWRTKEFIAAIAVLTGWLHFEWLKRCLHLSRQVPYTHKFYVTLYFTW